uniref:Uncharacterized protein n=1 Tax=Loxodonta africana TaxID=9785 RepID=G3TTZ8_LOXAF
QPFPCLVDPIRCYNSCQVAASSWHLPDGGGFIVSGTWRLGFVSTGSLLACVGKTPRPL